MPKFTNLCRVMLELIKREDIEMKKIMNLLSKISVGFLTIMILNIANSSSCYYIHQPEEPKEIENYKWIK